MPGTLLRYQAVFAAVLLAAWLPAFAQPDPREELAARIIEAARLERLVLAEARAKARVDPKLEQALDDEMYRLRGAALWSAQHPAWAPARNALRELAARDSNEWIAQFEAAQAGKTGVRDLAGSYRREYLADLLAFAESPGGAAYFARRLAEARVRAGESIFSLDPATPAQLEKLAAEARKRFEALPPAEKQRVKAYTVDIACTQCGDKSNVQFLDIYLNDRIRWMAEMMAMHWLGDSTEYRKRDAWRDALEAKFAAKLPVASTKQLLGTLEMRPDAALVFRFTFYANNAVDGGKLALEFPRSHPRYAEVLALVPGLAAGQSRVLYRDRDGLIGDKP